MYFVGRFDLNKLNNELASILDERSTPQHNILMSLLVGDKATIKDSKDIVTTSRGRFILQNYGCLLCVLDIARIRGCKRARLAKEVEVSKAWQPPTGNTLAQTILVGTFAEGLEGVNEEAFNLIDWALQIYIQRILANGIEETLAKEPCLPNIELYAASLADI